jgi:catechol 2,3-dioxygenase-like lactoylglutathione lyase family enzyme
MTLTMLYVPKKDLEAALALYRDTLGFEEAWREGDLTAGLILPGTEVQMMLDQDAAEHDKAGPFFQLDDVDAFYAERKDELAFVAPPKAIPPGRYVAFGEPWGKRTHVLDLSADREVDA